MLAGLSKNGDWITITKGRTRRLEISLRQSSRQNKRAKLAKPLDQKRVSGQERPNLPRIFESIQSKVDHLIEKKELPYLVHQGSSQHLISLFEMIRVHRNEAVHPNAGKVTREKIFLSIQTMPEALQVLSRLTDWFSSQATQN